MIKLSYNNFVDNNKLNKQELKAFIIFLKLERTRHLEDIAQINKTIRDLAQAEQP